jgi:ligand-binding SRPBCC domain-containing protein
MPFFEATVCLPRPVTEVFDFFIQPANLLRVTPPELHMRLVEGPERLQFGSRITFQGRRWGIPQRIVSEVTVFQPEVVFVDEQRRGPFRKWVHQHRFEALPDGTRLTDQIEFEPPGGVLGLLVTARVLERDLQWIYAYRQEKLVELLGASRPGSSTP